MNKVQTRRLDRAFKDHTAFYKALVTWLFEHRNELKIQVDECGDYNYFDYPDYGGMPKRLSNKLGCDDVDCIQAHQEEIGKVKSPVDILSWFIELP